MRNARIALRVLRRWLVHVDWSRRRVWCCGQRIHHGAFGAVLATVACVLMWHDRADTRVWFRRVP